jgi:Uncharacterized conserved protein
VSKVAKILVPLVIFWVAAGTLMRLFLNINDLSACLADESCKEVDAIVVISGGDTDARVKGGVDLYKKGVSKNLILSGAAADKSGPSNAAVMKDNAISLGVPEEAILIDEFSENTAENAQKARSIMEEEDIDSIVLVTSPYHQRRAYLEFQKELGIDVRIYNYPTPDDSSNSLAWWFMPWGMYRGVSEVFKIGFVYAR